MAVSPLTAAIHLLVSIGVTVLALTFKSRKLTMLDRVALLAFVVSLFWGAIDQRFASIKLLAGACCILVAWATDRFRAGRSEPSSKSAEQAEISKERVQRVNLQRAGEASH